MEIFYRFFFFFLGKGIFDLFRVGKSYIGCFIGGGSTFLGRRFLGGHDFKIDIRSVLGG